MENLHRDHRKRMKKRFLDKGLDGFSDHEVLELLLFFAIPRVNTNETAHRLLNRFSSLSAVLESSPDELKSVKGIGDNAATLVALFSQLTRRYEIDRSRPRDNFVSMGEIGRYLVNHFIGATREHVELLLFDAKMHMLDHITVHEGAVNSSDVNPERIAEIVFSRRASCFVLAHNHPNGRCVPSDEDIAVTRMLKQAFEPFNVNMLDHFLICGGEYIRLGAVC